MLKSLLIIPAALAMCACSQLNQIDKEFTMRMDSPSSQSKANSSTKHPLPLPTAQDHLKNYYDDGFYKQDIVEVTEVAKRQIEQKTSYGIHKKIGLVLDIDETVLSNWPWIEETLLGSPANPKTGSMTFQDWQKKGKAKGIFPMLEIYRLAQDKKVHVYFITERPESLKEITQLNLIREGFNQQHELIMRPESAEQTTTHFKSEARHKITEQGVNIILNIGDQAVDLEGGYADRNLKMPNPFYKRTN